MIMKLDGSAQNQAILGDIEIPSAICELSPFADQQAVHCDFQDSVIHYHASSSSENAGVGSLIKFSVTADFLRGCTISSNSNPAKILNNVSNFVRSGSFSKTDILAWVVLASLATSVCERLP
ncbi:hypothetical protein CF65_01729 [Aggregatibacter actinomycetemcomitans HK1651]|nr:hypothetical protein CF65_01729 [Aggregatibacter actinomycetemcomitans HK1651]